MKDLPPKSYEQWLSLSESEQDYIKEELWDAYERDRYDIPLMALARLVHTTERTVVMAAIGTYHGGEYLLHVYVPKSEIALCPRPLEQRFEGFRVHWLLHQAEDNGQYWNVDLQDLPLDVVGMPIRVNAKRHDIDIFVDVFDAAGNPIPVTRAGNWDYGIYFEVPDLSPDVDPCHLLLPQSDGTLVHEYKVRRVVHRGVFEPPD